MGRRDVPKTGKMVLGSRGAEGMFLTTAEWCLAVARGLTSLYEPLPHRLRDVEGHPLRGSPGEDILSSDVALLPDVLVGPQDLKHKNQEPSLVEAHAGAVCVNRER